MDFYGALPLSKVTTTRTSNRPPYRASAPSAHDHTGDRQGSRGIFLTEVVRHMELPDSICQSRPKFTLL